MKRLRKVKRVSPDEATLRAWEDMRIEILHEIEDGGDVTEDRVNAAGDVAALETPWSHVEVSTMGTPRIHVN